MTTAIAKSRPLRLAAALLLGALVLLAAFVAYRQLTPAAPVTLQTLRVASPRVSGAALHFIAADRGYFRAEGLDVQTIDTMTGRAAIDMAIAGTADIGIVSDSSFVIPAMQDQPIEILTSLSTAPGAVQIVARADGNIQAPRDLVGRRIGYTASTASDYFLWAFLIYQSIDSKQVQESSSSPPELLRRLGDGTLDAVAVWQPFIEMAQQQLGANVRSFQAPEISLLSAYASARTELARERPEIVQAYLRALVNAGRFAQAHTDEAITIAAQQVQISRAQMLAEWSSYQFKIQLDQAQLITLEDMAQWANDRGLAKARTDFRWHDRINLEPMLAVAPAAVTIIH